MIGEWMRMKNEGRKKMQGMIMLNEYGCGKMKSKIWRKGGMTNESYKAHDD